MHELSVDNRPVIAAAVPERSNPSTTSTLPHWWSMVGIRRGDEGILSFDVKGTALDSSLDGEFLVVAGFKTLSIVSVEVCGRDAAGFENVSPSFRALSATLPPHGSVSARTGR